MDTRNPTPIDATDVLCLGTVSGWGRFELHGTRLPRQDLLQLRTCPRNAVTPAAPTRHP